MNFLKATVINIGLYCFIVFVLTLCNNFFNKNYDEDLKLRFRYTKYDNKVVSIQEFMKKTLSKECGEGYTTGWAILEKSTKTYYFEDVRMILDARIPAPKFEDRATDVIQEKDLADVISIDPERPVVDALIIMAEYKIGALIVLKNKKMVGIISERDYAREIILKGRSSKTTLIKEIMTKDVLVLSPNDSFEKGLEIMTNNRVRHLPVVKENQVLGVLSLGDLVKEMIYHQRNLIEQLESFIKS